MTDFTLIAPSKEFESQAIEYIQEFLKHNSEINGTAGLNRYDNYDEWLLKLEKSLDIPNIPEGKEPGNTCNKTNVASAKVIQNNNGVLENEVFNEAFSEITQRYWINV